MKHISIQVEAHMNRTNRAIATKKKAHLCEQIQERQENNHDHNKKKKICFGRSWFGEKGLFQDMLVILSMVMHDKLKTKDHLYQWVSSLMMNACFVEENPKRKNILSSNVVIQKKYGDLILKR